MRRYRWLALVLLLCLGNPARSAAQATLAPLYALPADGTWIEAEWTATGPERREQAGILRISSVGQTWHEGVRYRWIEFKLETRQGESKTYRLRKLLVAESAFVPGGSLPGSVAEGLAQDRPGGPITRLPARRLETLLGMGIEGSGSALNALPGREQVTTPLGKLLTRHVWARGQDGPRTLEYHGWLTPAVPFGWAQFEIRETAGAAPARTVFMARVVRRGRKARSEMARQEDPNRTGGPQ